MTLADPKESASNPTADEKMKYDRALAATRRQNAAHGAKPWVERRKRTNPSVAKERIRVAARPASRPTNLDCEAAAIVGHAWIVDAQVESPGLFHVEGPALPNKEETTRHDPNPRHVLGAIERVEALP